LRVSLFTEPAAAIREVINEEESQMIPMGNFWRGEMWSREPGKWRGGGQEAAERLMEIVRRTVFGWLGWEFSRDILCDFPGVSLRSGT
jgi:hypothetical protein